MPPYLSDRPDVSKGRLLEKEPTNLQAQSLNTLIEDKATRGESPFKHFRTLVNLFSQMDTLEWPSQAALRLLVLCFSRA